MAIALALTGSMYFPAFALAPLFLYQPSEAQSIPITPSQSLEIALGTTTSATTTIDTPEPQNGFSWAVLNSCVKYVRTKIPSLPPIWTPDDLEPNTPIFVGAAALFKYDASGEPHIGYVEALGETCFFMSETNWKHGQYTERCVSYDDPNLRGFWTP